jgi:hypothetical protein
VRCVRSLNCPVVLPVLRTACGTSFAILQHMISTAHNVPGRRGLKVQADSMRLTSPVPACTCASAAVRLQQQQHTQQAAVAAAAAHAEAAQQKRVGAQFSWTRLFTYVSNAPPHAYKRARHGIHEACIPYAPVVHCYLITDVVCWDCLELPIIRNCGPLHTTLRACHIE